MTEKQSPYELLGLSDKASPEDIRQAFEARKLALEHEPDGEERRNRLSFLRQARDALSDPRRRALYDRHSRSQRAVTVQKAKPARALWPALTIILLATATYSGWHYPVADASVPPSVKAPPARAVTPTPVVELRFDEEIAALMPPTPVNAPTINAAPPEAVRQSSGTLQPGERKLVFSGPDAAVLAKLSDSTYLIMGAAGLGTGVAIEPDKLLTNCHVIAPNVLKGPIEAINPLTQEKTRIVAAAFLIREDACVVHAPGLNGKPIAFGDTRQLMRGARILNIGFAKGRLTASSGSFLGVINRVGQSYLVSSNYCDHGVSGGPLVDEEGRLVGLTSGGPADRSVCLSLTAETARTVLAQTLIVIDAFPTNYLSNLQRRW